MQAVNIDTEQYKEFAIDFHKIMRENQTLEFEVSNYRRVLKELFEIIAVLKREVKRSGS